MIDRGDTPVIIDVRSHAARLIDTRLIPGAVLADLNGIDRATYPIAFDQELITYCSCPNEVSAAKAAKALLSQGYRRVRPLLGGLDAWEEAGYPLEQVLTDAPLRVDAAASPERVH